MNQLILSILLFAVSFLRNDVNSFEGSINIVEKNCYNTFYYTYKVKNQNVRIDEFNKENKLLKSLLIDTDKETVFVLDSKNKAYANIKVKSVNNDLHNYMVIKSSNNRMVNGFKCYQWRVKNTKKNTEIAFWVTSNDLYFFEKLVKILNRTNENFMFFSRISESYGFFPMLTVERTLLRKEKNRIEVVKIKPENINNSVFIIPSDYKEVRIINS